MGKVERTSAYDQGAIYDARYHAGYNGMGSLVGVLSAERAVRAAALSRLLANNPGVDTVRMLDFGYGVGRVTNELLAKWTIPRHLQVTAYDVSRAGLLCAVQAVCGYLPVVTMGSDGDRLVATCRSAPGSPYSRMVRFVCGSQHTGPMQVAAELLHDNGDHPYDMVMAWYGPISHEPDSVRRSKQFRGLGQLTSPQGELLVTLATIGDMDSSMGPEPFDELEPTCPGDRDVVYQDETGQRNYWHLYGKRQFEASLRQTLTDPPGPIAVGATHPAQRP